MLYPTSNLFVRGHRIRLDLSSSSLSASIPEVVLTNGDSIDLHVRYHLTSRYLQALVAEGKAQYVGLLTCVRTFNRETYPTPLAEQHLTLSPHEYSQSFLFTPHLCTSTEVRGFISDEHSEEYRQVRPQGFDLPAASILAIGDTIAVSLEPASNPFSVIDLVKSNDVATGAFDVKLDDDRIKICFSEREKQLTGAFDVKLDDDRIKICFSEREKEAMDAFRMLGTQSTELIALFSGVYLHAVTEALRNLADYADKQWSDTVRWALHQNHINEDDEEIAANALRYAQVIMGHPVGRMLTAFTNPDEED